VRESLSNPYQTIITFITTKRHGLPSTPDAEEKHQITHNTTQHNTTQHVAENASLSDQKLSFILSFIFPEPPPLLLLAAAYIFTCS
jgi:hypothetical protein